MLSSENWLYELAELSSEDSSSSAHSEPTSRDDTDTHSGDNHTCCREISVRMLLDSMMNESLLPELCNDDKLVMNGDHW